MLRKLKQASETLAFLPQWQIVGIAILIVALCAGLFILYMGGTERNSIQVSVKEGAGESEDPGQEDLVVHVAGAVVCPGIYKLGQGSRVADAIKAAGGATEEADLIQLNLAEKVRDGQKIHVPKVGEAAAISQTGGGRQIININTADAKQLEQLPGIGPKLAQSIVDYREEKGAFKNVEELRKVKGIGPSKMEEIREMVTI